MNTKNKADESVEQRFQTDAEAYVRSFSKHAVDRLAEDYAVAEAARNVTKRLGYSPDGIEKIAWTNQGGSFSTQQRELISSWNSAHRRETRALLDTEDLRERTIQARIASEVRYRQSQAVDAERKRLEAEAEAVRTALKCTLCGELKAAKQIKRRCLTESPHSADAIYVDACVPCFLHAQQQLQMRLLTPARKAGVARFLDDALLRRATV